LPRPTPNHSHRRAHHHHRGAEVRFHQQQEGHRQEYQERLGEAPQAFTNFLLTTHQITGQVDHHEYLGQLRRLHVECAEADPAHGAIHLATDAR